MPDGFDPVVITHATVILGSVLASALFTWLSIAYAHRRNLLDLPGQRRSHSTPTPRGGGIGIVLAVMLSGCAAWLSWSPFAAQIPGLVLGIAVVLVAAIGWIDDHRPLSARVRIVVHLAAALLVVAAIAMPQQHAILSAIAAFLPAPVGVVGPALLLGALVTIAVVWFINLHNFMDGINGLLACQAIFVFAVLAAVCATSPGDPATGWLLLLPGAAVVGFLPFNFPRARVFMGDIGSGALGLLIAAAIGIAAAGLRGPALASGLIAASAFVVDASCTLLSRMLRGRRWYSAHREHLYQWLTRVGFSHAQVVGWYMGWNLLTVLPALCWLNRWPPFAHRPYPADPASNGEILRYLGLAGGIETAIVYALAVIVWIAGKRWCLHSMDSNRHLHAAA